MVRKLHRKLDKSKKFDKKTISVDAKRKEPPLAAVNWRVALTGLWAVALTSLSAARNVVETLSPVRL
eukprot:3611795-Alexandrium_andersonii.AAC.1